MKIKKDVLVIYASIHKKNTEKIAKEIGKVLDAKVINIQDASKKDVMNADLIGFGSGVYIGRFHKKLISFVKNLTETKGKECFVFSTSGMKRNIFLNRSHIHFKNILKKKEFKVIGEFNCLGYDTYGPLKYIGGVNKGRPNEKDINNAKKFAENIVK